MLDCKKQKIKAQKGQAPENTQDKTNISQPRQLKKKKKIPVKKNVKETGINKLTSSSSS